MRISEVAEQTGTSPSTLRFYESAGLISAARAANGYRVFDDETLARLQFIRTAKQFGLALEEIADLLPVWETRPCRDVRTELRPRVRARLAAARTRTADAAAFARALETGMERLEALPERDVPCDAECAVLAAPPTAPDIACSLDAAGLGDQVERWRVVLADGSIVSVANGASITLPLDRAAAAAEAAAAEHRCCPFIDFELRIEHGRVRLDVRASGAGVAVVHELFVPAG